MKKNYYLKPCIKVSMAKIRASILSGSNQLTGGENAYDGTDHANVPNPPSMQIEEAKKRVMDF